MKYLIYILLLIPLFVFAQERQVTIPSTDIVLERTDGSFDLTAAGKWFVQFPQHDWLKHSRTLYPNKTDRTRAVSDAQAAFKVELDKYVIEAIQGGFYSQQTGASVILSARTIFKYIAVSFKDGEFCKVYVREKNRQYILTLFPDLDDETSAATTARANMGTQLAIIDSAANAGGFYE